MGKYDGQKVHVNESKRPSDDAKSISYGPNIDSNGKVIDPGKAHLVVDSGGTVAYARNPDGKVIYDSKNDPSYKAP